MKSIPIVTLQCAYDMLHNRMEMLDRYVTDEKRTLWIRLKCGGLQNCRRCSLLLELPHLP